MMNTILRNCGNELLRRLKHAEDSIKSKEFPIEAVPCYEWVILKLANLTGKAKQIIGYLDLKIDDAILDQTLYSELTAVNNEIEVLDTYYIHPLYRLSDEDKLPLKILSWLHEVHPQTKDKAFILSNGSFSIAPSANSPVLYWLPVTSQFSLLHYPLFFHEFGHLLFLHHKKEMEDLIAEFQANLATFLQPAVSQSDSKYQSYVEKAADIVETWREWIEEFFCDAVGVAIGGESYLLAFSHFVRLGGIKEFFIPEKYLSRRSHPVSLLRIRFLVERATQMGLYDAATELENEWQSICSALQISEDYFGYYDESYKSNLNNLLDDMLTETNPIKFTDSNIPEIKNLPGYSVMNLLNEAWKKYLTSYEDFVTWESEVTALIVK